MNNPLRLCLDLNIWCARFLADRKGRHGTVSQELAKAVATGASPLGKVQLVVSWGMLNRLQKVLEMDLKATREEADAFIATIAQYAYLGHHATGPALTLGGVGLLPLSDAEDAHVLDTAIAGGSDILTTANFKDFKPRHVEILTPDRLARFTHPKGSLLIAHPYTVREWFLAGRISELH